jgi:hypothetical protein
VLSFDEIATAFNAANAGETHSWWMSSYERLRFTVEFYATLRGQSYPYLSMKDLASLALPISKAAPGRGIPMKNNFRALSLVNGWTWINGAWKWNVPVFDLRIDWAGMYKGNYGKDLASVLQIHIMKTWGSGDFSEGTISDSQFATGLWGLGALSGGASNPWQRKLASTILHSFDRNWGDAHGWAVYYAFNKGAVMLGANGPYLNLNKWVKYTTTNDKRSDSLTTALMDRVAGPGWNWDKQQINVNSMFSILNILAGDAIFPWATVIPPTSHSAGYTTWHDGSQYNGNDTGGSGYNAIQRLWKSDIDGAPTEWIHVNQLSWALAYGKATNPFVQYHHGFLG